MANTPNNEDPEIAAIAAMGIALGKLPDDEARRRVLAYFMQRYPSRAASPGERAALALHQSPSHHFVPASALAESAADREIPGIARLTESGEMKLTVRDLKAKSARDAALRLAYVAIYAYESLTGQPLSSRKGLTPLLKEWRVYDGNSRARLAREPGILRDGDALRLDAHARQDAEGFVAEILNDEVVGSWRPDGKLRLRRRS